MSTIVIIAIVAVAFVFCLGFLLITFSLLPAIRQLRAFLNDAEKTSARVREACQHLEKLGDQLSDKIEKADPIIYSAQKVMENTGAALQYLSQSFLKKSAAWLAFLPALRWGWKMVKKIKGGK